MSTIERERLRQIRTFPSLVKYLRDDLGWPIDSDDFDDLTFDYTPEELGIDAKTAAKIQDIKQLRKLTTAQQWGIFFVKFEPKRLPVVVLRRILSRLVVKKRASANAAERASWQKNDLLFISSFGEGDDRQISFAHFTDNDARGDLPTLKVLGWDQQDTALKLDHVHDTLGAKLRWPDDEDDSDAWRAQWASAFQLRPREVITTAKVLAVRLADLARDIRARVNAALAVESDTGPLTALMTAFKEALIHDLEPDDFADMYAQTIAYGLLSARVSRPAELVADNLADMVPITNPFLRELMETFLNVGGRKWSGDKGKLVGIDFDELGVNDVVDTLRDTNMEAVLRDFDNRNPQEDPVIHFYEHFLKEYDSKKRMQRGVFYTPKPVVSHIVRSVHEVLQTEFGLEDGLADTTTWGEIVTKHDDLALPTVKVKKPDSPDLIDEPIDPDTPFVQVLDPATGTATFLVEVIDVIHKTMTTKWEAEGHGDLWVNQKWNKYVPEHLLPRLHGYELMMAPYAIAHMKIGLKLFETGYAFDSGERARIYLTNALEPPQDFSSTFEQMAPALAHEAQAVNDVKRYQRFTVVIGNPPYSKMSSNLGDYAVGLIEPFRYVDGERIVERGALAHEINLQDDYVKFYALMFTLLRASDAGIGSFISNFRYIDSGSLRGFRHFALTSFDALSLLHLGGHVADRNTLAEPDDNVFDIEQGVAIALLQRKTLALARPQVRFGRLLGNREEKNNMLDASTMPALATEDLEPTSPFYTFRPAGGNEEAEFRNWSGLDALFPVNSGCVITSRDNLTIGFSPEELLAVVERFATSADGDTEIQEQIGFSVKAKWDVEACKRLIRRQGVRRQSVRPILYRPFDVRYVYYLPQLLDTPSRPVSDLLTARDNIVLLAPKVKTTPVFTHALVSRDTAEKKVASHDRATQMFPLWAESLGKRTPNLDGTRLGVAASSDNAEHLFCYCYSILYSNGYRARYGQVLREVFPNIPVPKEKSLFGQLASLGSSLVALHLLESPLLSNPITTYVGPANPEAEKVSYADGAVWLDKAQTRGFVGVPEEVWNFHIGGYQVCHKWLKDRQKKGGKNPRSGRILTVGDLAHYQKIVVALNETICLMKEIDEVIDRHGGWPAAFQTSEANSVTNGATTFRPRIVKPRPEDRYTTCVPLVPLKAAAGAFGDPQHINEEELEWTAVEAQHRLRPGMFVAQVVGKSMEPAIPDGAYCLFATPVKGTRQGKTVLVQLRDATDPETGQRYTVKRYQSEKAKQGDSWRHERITLKPLNPDFEPIVLTGADEGDLQVVAELIEVLARETLTEGD